MSDDKETATETTEQTAGEEPAAKEEIISATLFEPVNHRGQLSDDKKRPKMAEEGEPKKPNNEHLQLTMSGESGQRSGPLSCTGRAARALEMFKKRQTEIRLEGRCKPDMIAFKELGKDWSPARIHGEIPGVPIGLELDGRGEAAVLGIHKKIMCGIDGMKGEPCYAICLSGRYSDDDDQDGFDDDDKIVYTGEGGQKGQRQVKDQEQNASNRSLILSKLSQKPIRVLRKQQRTMTRTKKQREYYLYCGLYLCADYTYEPSADGPKVYKFTLVPVKGRVVCKEKLQQQPPPLAKARKRRRRPAHISVNVDGSGGCSGQMQKSEELKCKTMDKISILSPDETATDSSNGVSSSAAHTTIPGLDAFVAAKRKETTWYHKIPRRRDVVSSSIVANQERTYKIPRRRDHHASIIVANQEHYEIQRHQDDADAFVDDAANNTNQEATYYKIPRRGRRAAKEKNSSSSCHTTGSGSCSSSDLVPASPSSLPKHMVPKKILEI